MKISKNHDKKYCVLLVIDMLNDFINEGSPLEVPMARKIIPNIQHQIAFARRHNIPVIYCCDRHKHNDTEFQIWGAHAIKGTEGARIIEQLEQNNEDHVVAKTSHSCFYKTRLNTLLRKLNRTHLIITGVLTNICVMYTALDAYMRGYKVTIPQNCVAALTKREHQFAMQQMSRIFHAKIV